MKKKVRRTRPPQANWLLPSQARSALIAPLWHVHDAAVVLQRLEAEGQRHPRLTTMREAVEKLEADIIAAMVDLVQGGLPQ